MDVAERNRRLDEIAEILRCRDQAPKAAADLAYHKLCELREAEPLDEPPPWWHEFWPYCGEFVKQHGWEAAAREFGHRLKFANDQLGKATERASQPCREAHEPTEAMVEAGITARSLNVLHDTTLEMVGRVYNAMEAARVTAAKGE